MSEVNSTFLNKKEITQLTELGHMDIFTINDRSFRFEYPELIKVRSPLFLSSTVIRRPLAFRFFVCALRFT